MGVGNPASTQLDMLQAQYNLNGKISDIIGGMKGLTDEIRKGNVTSQRLQEINMLMQELQRDLEAAKQALESLKKAMEKINEMPR